MSSRDETSLFVNKSDRAPAQEPGAGPADAEASLSERRPERRGGDSRAKGERRPRPERSFPDRGGKREKASVGSIVELDREILRLIARRTHLRDELPSGREATRTERELRSAWEANAARVSRDPRLIRQAFALLQQVECLQKRQEESPEQEAFNLNPSRAAVNVAMKGLSDCRRSRILGALSAGTGSANLLTDILINDPLVELVKAFNHISPCLRWEDDGRVACVADSKSLNADKALLDRAVHVGNDMFNFLLVLCIMAVRPCRLKFMGGSDLKLADLSALRHFLPSLGARFTSIVPGQEGLPARLEASGILPEQVGIPSDLPRDAALAVCLGLFCAPRDHSIRVELDGHPDAGSILDELNDILSMAHVVPRLEDSSLYLAPDPRPVFMLPQDVRVALDLPLIGILLSVPLFVGGKVEVEGLWPESPAAEACWKLLEAAGLRLTKNRYGVTATAEPQNTFDAALFAPYDKNLPESLFPLATLFAAMGAVRSGAACLPECVMRGCELDVVDDFLARLGLSRDGSRLCGGTPDRLTDLPWSCPSPIWAAVLAQAAFLKPNLKLLNPGIVVDYMPGFWQWYNSLPNPVLNRPPAVSVEQPPLPSRRRIRAGYMPEDRMPTPQNPDQD